MKKVIQFSHDSRNLDKNIQIGEMIETNFNSSNL